MKHTISRIKSPLQAVKSELEDIEELISDLEDRVMESTWAEQQKAKRMKRKEDKLREVWDIKDPNIRIIGVPEEERERGKKTYLMK